MQATPVPKTKVFQEIYCPFCDKLVTSELRFISQTGLAAAVCADKSICFQLRSEGIIFDGKNCFIQSCVRCYNNSMSAASFAREIYPNVYCFKLIKEKKRRITIKMDNPIDCKYTGSDGKKKTLVKTQINSKLFESYICVCQGDLFLMIKTGEVALNINSLYLMTTHTERQFLLLDHVVVPREKAAYQNSDQEEGVIMDVHYDADLTTWVYDVRLTLTGKMVKMPNDLLTKSEINFEEETPNTRSSSNYQGFMFFVVDVFSFIFLLSFGIKCFHSSQWCFGADRCWQQETSL